MSNNHKKSSAGKGYIALLLCAAAIGISGYLYYRETNEVKPQPGIPDVTVAVTAPEECRVARLLLRDGITEEYARNRIAAQKPQAEFSRLCDHTLHNDGTREDFQKKCLAFLQELNIIKA